MYVIVYSTPTCPYCRMVKDYLSRSNVSFKEVDVSVDKKAAEHMIKKSGQMGVPVIEIGKRIIIGFNIAEINDALTSLKRTSAKKTVKKVVIKKSAVKRKLVSKKKNIKKIVKKNYNEVHK